MPIKDYSVNSLNHSRFTEGSNGNKSVVKTNSVFPVIPTGSEAGFGHLRKFLNNAGNIEINVDGSVTPQTFSVSVSANERYWIHSIHTIFTDNANVNSLDDFLSLPALTNGLLFEQTIDSVTTTSAIAKNNFDILHNLNSTFDVKAVGSYTIINGEVPLSIPAYLDGSKGDTLSVTVQDDLSPLTQCTIAVTGIVEIFQ